MSALNEINAGNKWASMSYTQFDEKLAFLKSSIIEFKACDKPYVVFRNKDTGVLDSKIYRTEAIKIFQMMYEETLYHACMKGMPDHIKYKMPE